MKNALMMIALPLVVFAAAGWIMVQLSQHAAVEERYPPQHKPLNQRFLGYDKKEAVAHWELLGDLLPAEQRFLEIDLIFPFLYGGALAVSLLMGWALLGRPFNVAWVFLPAVGAVVADWTENLIQLRQLQRFADGGPQMVQAGWIAVAGVATIVKLGALVVCVGVILAMAAWIGLRPAR